jgi:1-acyl-sn-glycerol-3-phosphate acyltransferase
MAYLLTKAGAPLFNKLWLKKCIGIENIPKDKGFLLVANHASYMDHLLIGCAIVPKIKRTIHFLAKKEHFDTFFQRQWHNYCKAIPIDRKAGGKEALAKAVAHLKKGNIIMIYPEGTRTLTGKMNKARTGVARLALWAQVPVVPIGLTNTFEMLPKGKRFPKTSKKATIRIGAPMYFSEYYNSAHDKEAWEEITTKIMKRIAELANTKYEF